ncbi:hypothetical protein AB0M12_32815 [Nocardia vinacea]|uniref:hypothetical protein n=1 Tax=Nocardia vinacea TaxID=96468 RepID=UPI0034427959
MDWLSFLAAMTGNLAWPAVAITGGVVFRRQLGDIAARFKSLLDDRVEEASIGRGGLSLRRKVDADLQKAEAALGPADSEEDQIALPPPSTQFLDEVEQLTTIAPAAAIALASGRLETTLREVLAQRGDTSDRPRGLNELLRACARQELLTPNEAEAGKYLVRVRNEAVHTSVSTPGQAIEFAEMALRIATSARLAAGETIVDGDPL